MTRCRVFVGGLGLLLAGSANSAEEIRDRYTIGLPGEQWVISLAIPGYRVEREETRRDQSGIMMAGRHDGKKVNLSIFLEREKKPRTSEQCRKKYFPSSLSSPLWKSQIKRWETETLALGQYLVKVKESLEFEQMHMHAYLGEGDVCMDLHLSMVGFEESDRATFEEVLSSVRLERKVED